jgi:hypothetical protein
MIGSASWRQGQREALEDFGCGHVAFQEVPAPNEHDFALQLLHRYDLLLSDETKQVIRGQKTQQTSYVPFTAFG